MPKYLIYPEALLHFYLPSKQRSIIKSKLEHYHIH